jgi:hypothetical protein
MNRLTCLLAALSCALLIGVACAQDASPPPGPQPAGAPGPDAQSPGAQSPGGQRRGGMGGPGFGFRMPTFPLLETLDADKDGKLSQAEIDGAVAALKKLDKDGDGKLSKEEIGWPPVGMGRGRPGMMGSGGPGFGPGGVGGDPGVSFVDRIMNNDKNSDGKVTKEELPERMQWMVQRLDTNRDGAIDKAEAEAAAAPRPRRGGASPGGEQPKDPPANPDGK